MHSESLRHQPRVLTPDSADRLTGAHGDGALSGATPSKKRARDPNAENGSMVRASRPRTTTTTARSSSSFADAKCRHDAPAVDNLAEYNPGQILAVELTDFQVCARGSYKFEPFLNLVVGPNGSGKSTVITAIFLLMNGEQKDTSRTSSDDFIRMGCDTARATAWIKGTSGGSSSASIKISLFLQRGATPVYEINDRQVEKPKLDHLTAQYNIQVNNRCQFLPQERVASFSAETAHQRLISTLESVGEQNMVSTLTKLIEFGANVREYQESAGQNNTEIETLTSEREKQEANVERLKQLYQEKKELEALRSMKVIAQYRDAKAVCDTANANLQEAQRDKAEFRARNQPLYDAKKRFENLSRSAAQSKDKSIDTDRQVSGQLDRLLAAIKQESLNTTMADITSLQTEKEQSTMDIKTARTKLKQKHQDVDKMRGLLDQEALLDAETKVEALNQVLRDLDRKREAARQAVAPQELRASGLQTRRNELLSERKKTQEQRLLLYRNSSKIREAVALVADNKHLFKQAVFPPPLLTIKIKPGAEKQVNAVLNQNTLEMFICQNTEDFRNLSNLFDRNGQNIRIVTSASSSNPQTQLRNKLVEMGFDGVISDLIVDEAPVVDYLCSSFHLDKVPYSTQQRLSSTAENGIKSLPNLPVQRYLTPEHSVRLNRSRYGSRQISENRSPLDPNYHWVSQVSQSIQEINSAQNTKLEELATELSNMRTEIEGLNAQVQEVETARLVKIEERKPYHDIIKKQKTFQNMLISGKREIEELEAKQARAESTLAEFDTREQEMAMSFGSRFTVCSSSQVSAQASRIVPYTIDYTMARADACESASGTNRVKHEIEACMESIARQIRAFTEQYEAACRKVDMLQPKMDELRAKLSRQELKEAGEKAASMSSQEIETAVAQLEASLALNESGESYEQAVKILEQTVARLEKLVARRASANSQLDTAQKELDKVAPEFEQKSRSLVANISQKYAEFFSRLGCTGLVELNAPPLKFEEWGIEIKVSYREGESPRALSAKTQSGGEKAVATATYLMALQGYSKAPFFVVDEINQGMDNINERAIHKFIVETACVHNPRQYFMVTPKLLPDLTFHPRIKVLCHNSTVNIVHP